MIKSYRFFMTPMCPNCGEIDEYLKTVRVKGERFDATTDEGLEAAQKSEVMSVPTLIFVDENGGEQSRAHNITDVKKVLENRSLLDI
jgi:hypothetical protein